ncbi:lacto-N-biose phosphorylase central domain-containing protein, partial [Bifidobacterium bifidum]|uniref:lacto-N-biose phosphorylase central domain-containing protein n=1 Tax=Bifidobacterium bifidum TaxID=1681 RepID=UPI002FD85CAF
VTGGPVDTAFSGGSVWAEEPRLAATLRAWVHGGGALIGVGQPSAQQFQGRFFQLADVLGVDEERHQTLVTPEHFITADVHLGEGVLQGFLDAGYRKPLSGCGGGQAIGELGGIDFGEPIA